jgi:hypothetical protein
MSGSLTGINRCPHCNIAAPRLEVSWASMGPTLRRDGQNRHHWALFLCASCGAGVTAYGIMVAGGFIVPECYPTAKSAHEDIPEIARTFLQQAIDTLHAPDAAAVMAGSAVDAMLKAKSYEKGSLYDRIDKALADNVLTKGMADWAHEVRLGSNRPRHADADRPHVKPEEAKNSVEFAESLGNFLFVLTAKIERGIETAKPKTA